MDRSPQHAVTALSHARLAHLAPAPPAPTRAAWVAQARRHVTLLCAAILSLLLPLGLAQPATAKTDDAVAKQAAALMLEHEASTAAEAPPRGPWEDRPIRELERLARSAPDSALDALMPGMDRKARIAASRVHAMDVRHTFAAAQATRRSRAPAKWRAALSAALDAPLPALTPAALADVLAHPPLLHDDPAADAVHLAVLRLVITRRAAAALPAFGTNAPPRQLAAAAHAGHRELRAVEPVLEACVDTGVDLPDALSDPHSKRQSVCRLAAARERLALMLLDVADHAARIVREAATRPKSTTERDALLERQRARAERALDSLARARLLDVRWRDVWTRASTNDTDEPALDADLATQWHALGKADAMLGARLAIAELAILDALEAARQLWLDGPGGADDRGYGADGWAMRAHEAAMLLAHLRVGWGSRTQALAQDLTLTGDGSETAEHGFGALFALFILGGALWLWRRGPALYKRIKPRLLSGATSAGALRAEHRVLSMLEVSGTALLIAGTTQALVWGPGANLPPFETAAIRAVGWWWAGYVFSIHAVHRGVLYLARGHLRLRVPTKLKVLRTVRLVGRVLLTVWVALSLSHGAFGDGALHAMVRHLAYLALLVTLLIAVNRWKTSIQNAIVTYDPDTRLAKWLTPADGGDPSLFAAVAGLGALALDAGYVVGRDFLLSFEQSRRALAYLFKLRVERDAEKRGHQTSDTGALPDAVKAAFADAPAGKAVRIPERLGRIDEACAGLHAAMPERWLVRGITGHGRTTWTHALLEAVGAMAKRGSTGETPRESVPENTAPAGINADDIVVLTPAARLTSEQALCDALAAAAHVRWQPALRRADPTHDLADALRTAGTRLIVLDGLEMLFVRRVGGYAALDALLRLMRRLETVGFVVTVTDPAFRHVAAVRALETAFDHTHKLAAWGEEDIRKLLLGRMRRSNVSVDFGELLVRNVDGAQAAEVVSTQDEYVRLLWTFAEGNPRIALHFWLRSLVPQKEHAVRAQLYRGPATDDLERTSEFERFVLSSIVQHGRIGASELSAALDAPRRDVVAAMVRLRRRGVLEVCPLSPTDDALDPDTRSPDTRSPDTRSPDTRSQGANGPQPEEPVTVSVHWFEAVRRFLKRKTLHP